MGQIVKGKVRAAHRDDGYTPLVLPFDLQASRAPGHEFKYFEILWCIAGTGYGDQPDQGIYRSIPAEMAGENRGNGAKQGKR